MKKNEPVSQSGGTRKYRVKKDTLSKLESEKISQFEKHMIQEGVKQILFAQGSEEFIGQDIFYRSVPKEFIQFLLDYDIIEEYQFE